MRPPPDRLLQFSIAPECPPRRGPKQPNRDFLGVPGRSNRLYKLRGIFVGRICYERHMRNPGIELRQQLDPLSPGCKFEISEACDIATGTSQMSINR